MALAGTPRYRKTRSGAPPHPYVLAGLAAGSALPGLAAATQYAAHRFGYHPNLGAPVSDPGTAAAVAIGILGLAAGALLGRGRNTRPAAPLALLLAAASFTAALGPLYSPFRIVQWGLAYRRASAGDPDAWAVLQPVFEGATLAGLAAFACSFVALGAVALSATSKHASNAHGTAEFGSGAELALPRREERRRAAARRAGRRVVEPGIMIGRLPSTPHPFLPWRTRPGRLLWYHGPSHVLTMAPTRSGKGVGAVIPALLRYPGSVVCMDVKGENFHVTHRQRLADGGEVFVLDPFGITGEHAHHAVANPLDTIDTRGSGSDRALDDCKTLAEMLVEEEGRENRHFVDEGRSLLACMMLHVCHEYWSRAEERTMMKVRELLTLPREEFDVLLEEMSMSDNVLVRRGVARLQQKEDRERTGVVSTAQRATDLFDSIPMASVLVPGPAAADGARGGRRCIDLGSIKGAVPVTIYVVVPEDMLKTHAAWIRMMVACVNHTVTRTPGRPRHRILVLLDEFAQLGAMRPVVEGISLVGGYGILFWLIVQDIAQLKGLYRDRWETLIANTDVKQCFGTNDWTTADLLSKMAGETTVFTEGGSAGQGRSFGRSSGHSTNFGESVSEKGRRLLMADEVMRLPQGKQIVFVKGSEVLLVDKINYLTDPEFRGGGGKPLFGPNPMYG